MQYLLALHQEFNESDFGGKLRDIPILMKRNKTKDGWYEYHTRKRTGEDTGHKGSGWCPDRNRLEDAYIVITDLCYAEGEDLVQGTLLHEMIHQYQAEILDRPGSHDAIFTSMARRLERKHGIKIR